MLTFPIPGYETSYAATEYGHIISLPRTIERKTGGPLTIPKRFLQAHPNKNVQYLQVDLWKNNKGKTHYVHRLVAQAAIPNPNDLLEVNHKDGNRQNNRVDNLEWCDSSGNSQHAVNTGLREYTNRLTRDEFLECLTAVITGESYASVSSRVPYKVPYLSTKLRKLAIEENLEHLLNESLMNQRVERARINGASFRRTG